MYVQKTLQQYLNTYVLGKHQVATLQNLYDCLNLLSVFDYIISLLKMVGIYIAYRLTIKF